jgi:heterodisulfide reductase subunit A
LTALQMALSRLKGIEPAAMAKIPVTRRALVVGGGIAGMHAALSIADHGYPVDLVECGDRLGGNLAWLKETIAGEPIAPLLEETVRKVEKHPHVETRLNSKIAGAFGEVGSFYTTIESDDGSVQTIQHGTVVLATGGGEASTEAYGFGTSESIITQKDLETRLAGDELDPQEFKSVVMIQCVGSREEPRNFCSRVCCPTALKHALKIKSRSPDTAVYVLYRDMMTPGFAESHFTAARKAGVVFIQYDVSDKPQVSAGQEPGYALQVATRDPILGQPVVINAGLVVLAAGVRPQLTPELASMFGARLDEDGFFQEADSKWRPVDALREGVFGCGLALSPRSIPDAVASAGAAAQRCLRILAHDRLPTGKIVATVRHSLCCLCERCVEACPYEARSVDPDQGKVQVNPAMCQGCGECAATCPNSAAIVAGFTDRQMLDVIDSALT